VGGGDVLALDVLQLTAPGPLDADNRDDAERGRDAQGQRDDDAAKADALR